MEDITSQYGLTSNKIKTILAELDKFIKATDDKKPKLRAMRIYWTLDKANKRGFGQMLSKFVAAVTNDGEQKFNEFCFFMFDLRHFFQQVIWSAKSPMNKTLEPYQKQKKNFSQTIAYLLLTKHFDPEQWKKAGVQPSDQEIIRAAFNGEQPDMTKLAMYETKFFDAYQKNKEKANLPQVHTRKRSKPSDSEDEDDDDEEEEEEETKKEPRKKKRQKVTQSEFITRQLELTANIQTFNQQLKQDKIDFELQLKSLQTQLTKCQDDYAKKSKTDNAQLKAFMLQLQELSTDEARK